MTDKVEAHRESIMQQQATWFGEHFMPALTDAATRTDGVDIDDIVADPAFEDIGKLAKTVWSYCRDTLPTQESGQFTPMIHANTDAGDVLIVMPEMADDNADLRRFAREVMAPAVLKKIEAKAALVATEVWYIEQKMQPGMKLEATTADEARAEVSKTMSVPVREDDRRKSAIMAMVLTPMTELLMTFTINEGDGRKLSPVPTIIVAKNKGAMLPLMRSHWYSDETPDLPDSMMTGVGEAAE
jgi:hypothetical protein